MKKHILKKCLIVFKRLNKSFTNKQPKHKFIFFLSAALFEGNEKKRRAQRRIFIPSLRP
jgi:hypothetical protein